MEDPDFRSVATRGQAGASWLRGLMRGAGDELGDGIWCGASAASSRLSAGATAIMPNMCEALEDRLTRRSRTGQP